MLTNNFLKVAILIIIHSNFCVSNENCDNEEIKGDLVFVHILFRHGDRTPVDPYPTDPWKNLSYWPTGWGQLTNIGKREHFELGQWLRKRYNTLLSENYSNEEIYVKSTDVDRTLMSALSNLAGLYPPQNDDIWDENIKWQPIPVHTVPENMDHILAAKQKCSAYSKALSAVYNSPEIQNIKNRYKSLFEYLTKNTGREIKTFEDVMRVNNTLYIESLYNKTLPEWSKKVYPGKDMSFISDFSFAIHTYTRKLARLKYGPLIKEILDRSNAKAKGKLSPNRSMWIYSAHDITVASVLNTLKIFEYHSPPYTACIMFELRIDGNNQPFLLVYYKNTTGEPRLMKLPGCDVSCPLEKVYSLYEDILLEDWDSECKAFSITDAYKSGESDSIIEICLIVVAAILVVYFVGAFYRRRAYKAYEIA